MIPIPLGFLIRPQIGGGGGGEPSYAEWYNVIDYVLLDDWVSGNEKPNLTLKRQWNTGGAGVSVSEGVSKFGLRSVYFDGSAGCTFNTITEVNDSVEIKNTEPFTAEFFFWPDSTGETVDDQMFEIYGTGNGHGLRVKFLHSASPKKWQLSVANSNVWTDYESGSFDFDALEGQWNHFALVKEDNATTKLYINGVAVITASGTMPPLEESRTYVGSTSGGANAFTGWMDEIFITKLKMYDGNFTPRTGRYIAVQTVDKILFPLDTGLLDVYEVATGSGGSITTDYSKWGTGSLARLGSHTGFIMPRVPLMNMYNKEFCIEFWYRPNSIPPNSGASHALFSFAGDVYGYIPMHIRINNLYIYSDHYMEFPQNTYGVGFGAHGMSAGNWYHIAYVRSPTKHSLYVNGTRLGSGGSPNRGSKILYSLYTTGPARLGIFPNNFYPCDGHFNDFRWTIGSSVYDATQATITVPTGPLE